ncbi:uncharacterized protein HMPREF1541_03280 [Cyphellophora europaea CBS 101466]|uniref:Methylated-DNA--protein-cysteine methyltransferase n=1 Tax=Cyphellophora europaea (strain CBS 101466) TaxID=1220924 RepID=W2RYD8_CYPE1|nr:uncharacterized protein HMPREF1541_03280 [Cyphellophora europaea CBS 101466]ETN41345.1 hypothetical protein HMPREF1541_03280 [Cyphellophora europaea CBS 101466]
MGNIEALREEWKTLYASKLPAFARAKNSAQPRWPVTLDHCFARIILDNTVGQGTQQWDKVIRKPAVKHMSEHQLKDAIDLGKRIELGEINICDLDQISLVCRGKNETKYDTARSTNSGKTKRKSTANDFATSDETKLKKPRTSSQQSTLSFATSPRKGEKATSASAKEDMDPNVDFAATLDKIRNHSSLTPYRKRLYTVLLSVPRGRFTTYAAMSDYLESSARAVGNGMRNNPFAPDVPCHRVLAADGSIGGFHGSWGPEGKYANDKLRLLRIEGVCFDGKGKVIGQPFRGFHEFRELNGGVKST